MGIYLLVQKTIVHNFYGFRKVRFHRYSPQFKGNQVVLLLKQWRRLLLTSLKLSFKNICRSLRNGDLFTGPKHYCSQFFADSTKFVSTATVHSSNGIKSFFYSNNDDDFFFDPWNFRLNTICRRLRNGDLFTGPKDYCSQFLRIPQSTFPPMQSTVQRESSRSSTQTMTTTSSYIVETFV